MDKDLFIEIKESIYELSSRITKVNNARHAKGVKKRLQLLCFVGETSAIEDGRVKLDKSTIINASTSFIFDAIYNLMKNRPEIALMVLRYMMAEMAEDMESNFNQ